MENNYNQKLLIVNKFVRKCPDSLEYNERLERELKIIVEKNFVSYILQVCDILELVGDIPHIIRGSAGSSLVCWLLGITTIDPILNSICFSRFLNEFRNSMPDIDIDFPHNQRNKIFKKIFDKWKNVVRVSNYVCYKDKSAIRKALKEMGVKGKIDKTKCNLNYWKDKEKKKELSKKVNEIKNTFKNYSLHCGGIIFFTNIEDMSKYKIVNRQIMLNKNDIESEGFFKIDILANRGLSQLINIDSKPLDKYDFFDKKTIELFCSGNNIGLTFAESPGMRKIFSTLKPQSVLDIAKCLALIRPGSTTNSDFKLNKDNLDICDEIISDENTLSNDDNIIFDDDAIKYIQKLINCNESEADNIRRIYTKADGIKIGQFELELMELKPELDIEQISIISSKLINLRKYSFCKSHSLSYSYLVWALAWNKANNPKKFWESTIVNTKSMYRKWVHLREAICSGVKITKTNNKIDHDNKLNDKEHFYKYGFWLGKNFLDSTNMFVNIIDSEEKNTCEFRGLIATSKYYKKYNSKTKLNDLVTFVTIGYSNQIYIDLIIKGWIKTKHLNIFSGKGIVKIIGDYAYINVEKIY